MTKELEERMSLLEAELEHSKSSPRLLKSRRNRIKRISAIIFCVTLILVSVVAVVIVHNSNKQPSSLPDRIKRAVAFPLYTPRDTKSFKLDADSIQVESGTVTFTGYYNGNPVILTEQKKPQQFNASLVEGGSSYDLPIGKAYTSTLGSKLAGIIIAKETMITISTPRQDDQTVTSLTSSF